MQLSNIQFGISKRLPRQRKSPAPDVCITSPSTRGMPIVNNAAPFLIYVDSRSQAKGAETRKQPSLLNKLAELSSTSPSSPHQASATPLILRLNTYHRNHFGPDGKLTFQTGRGHNLSIEDRRPEWKGVSPVPETMPQALIVPTNIFDRGNTYIHTDPKALDPNATTSDLLTCARLNRELLAAAKNLYKHQIAVRLKELRNVRKRPVLNQGLVDFQQQFLTEERLNWRLHRDELEAQYQLAAQRAVASMAAKP